MRLVVDANILFSALYDMDSTAGGLLFLAIEEQLELFSSEHVKKEMRRILVAKLGYSEREVDELISALPVEWLEEGLYEDAMGEAMATLQDEADASLLACASVLACDVVSGDKMVLASKFRKVRVRRLRDFRNP